MGVYHMQVNHLNNPLGFLMNRTVFGWKVNDVKGKQQKAARVIVALDENLNDVVYDTGFCAEADSLGWELPVSLKPQTRYFWTVTVQTDAEEEITGEVQWFETPLAEDGWQAQWITCDSIQKRHPYFEKKIVPKKPVKKARLYVSGLGLYEAYYVPEEKAAEQEADCGEGKSSVVSGAMIPEDYKIGDEYLTPYSNNYNRWVQYQTYDVTKELQQEGTLSILLGNGWYKARFGFSAIEDIGFYGNEWKLIAMLVLEYEDGSCEHIGTDESWSVRRSRITFSNLYDGEHRDDTIEDLAGEMAEVCEAPKGKLTPRMSTPVTVHETFAPAELIKTPAGEQVFDIGQEITGSFRLRVNEPAGTKIHIQTGEVLQNGNFYNGNLRSAKSEYIYISDGQETVLIPHFTYFGYRYVKITGISNLKKEDFTAVTLYSDLHDTGAMKTGHELVNKLLSNVRWGLKDNFLDVPTDCPQRDERMGWTGDAQVFSPTATYLEDTYSFYAKYLYDMWQEQQDMNGKVPDVVPSCGVDSCACVWGDSSCIIPWNLYCFYGDTSILKDQYPSMKAWVDYVRKVDGDNHGWRHVFHYGDWLALDNPVGGVDQVLGGTDEEYIANIYYAASAEIVAKAAKILGYEDDAAEYGVLAQREFDEVKREYFSPNGRCCIKTQTALTLALKYHLTSDEEKTKKQLYKLFEENEYKLKTGFVGTPLLCNVLTENGFDELAFKLLLNEEYPGWLHEVLLGATTVWERWNSLDENGNISSTGMNSLNHYSYGSIAEWMFAHVAGLCQKKDGIGFRTLDMKPLFNRDLKHMEAYYDSPAGKYELAWELIDDTHVTLKVTVPFGCQANLTLPYADLKIFETAENPMFACVKDGVCVLEPGTYEVSYEMTGFMKKAYSVDTSIRELQANPAIVEAAKDIYPLDNIPGQYLHMSLRDLVAYYGKPEQEADLEKMEKLLASM